MGIHVNRREASKMPLNRVLRSGPEKDQLVRTSTTSGSIPAAQGTLPQVV